MWIRMWRFSLNMAFTITLLMLLGSVSALTSSRNSKGPPKDIQGVLGKREQLSASVPVGLEDSPLSHTSAVEGDRAFLACDVTTPAPGDQPILVLFYSGARGTPIYSIDARSGPFSMAAHWSAADLMSRAHFEVGRSPSGLVLEAVEIQDEGDYRCRVDFRASPTRNLRVRLAVIIPPGAVVISGRGGQELSGVIGPYPVDKPLELTCTTTGGIPRPMVTWWHDGSLLDDSSEVSVGDVVRNTLSLPRLSRHHLHQVFTCQASNSNLTRPMAQQVTLDLSIPPVEVSILGSNEALSVGESYSVVCEAKGSRPPATVTWWKNGKMLTTTKDEVVTDGKISRSTLRIEPSRYDNSATLVCRAENNQLPASALEDTRKLKIYFPPEVNIRAGSNLDMSDIKEGDDTYFECDIQANPHVYKIQWFHNGREISHNLTNGVIQSNQSLVLQRVTRASSGIYTCQAANMEGTATSGTLHLNVMYLPLCAPGQQLVYGSGRQEAVNITCNVEAFPVPIHFKWSFNTSTELIDLQSTRPDLGRTQSTLSYTPRTHLDFGSLLCWAVNDVGQQRQPCHYHIVPAAVPEPVGSCNVSHNASAQGVVEVGCQAGWGGGLAQTFTLEIRATPGGRVLAQLRDHVEPHFTVKGLAPGTQYNLAVVAHNSQGPSTTMAFTYVTPIDVAEKQTSAAVAKGHLLFVSPILGILLGIAVAMVICSVVLFIIFRGRRGKRTPRHDDKHTKIMYDKAETDMKNSEDGGFNKKDVGPDIILVKPDNKVMAQEKELLQHYITARDASFYINPGSLLNNSVPGIGEKDALLRDMQQRPNMMTSTPLRQPFLAPLASLDSLGTTLGRRSPAQSSIASSHCSSSLMSSGSHQGSASTVALHPNYCSGEQDYQDPARTPFVTPRITPRVTPRGTPSPSSTPTPSITASLTRESSV